MKVVNEISQLKQDLKEVTKVIGCLGEQSVGFVPTMGALHDGHISLIKQAREENDIVVVSIFVNPTQFLAGEDLDKYPNKMDADKKICQLAGVDFLFTPDVNIMYEDDEVLVKAPNIRSYTLEGERRPGHFDGVLQVVLKLFNIVNPTKAYFGKKDAQQLSLIKQMVKNFYMDINIVECEIVREPDGLAMSSRNVYLSDDERKESLKISKSLKIATKQIMMGELRSQKIIESMEQTLDGIEIEYISIVNREFDKLEKVEIKNTMILVAVKIGTTRLIDNIWV